MKLPLTTSEPKNQRLFPMSTSPVILVHGMNKPSFLSTSKEVAQRLLLNTPGILMEKASESITAAPEMEKFVKVLVRPSQKMIPTPNLKLNSFKPLISEVNTGSSDWLRITPIPLSAPPTTDTYGSSIDNPTCQKPCIKKSSLTLRKTTSQSKSWSGLSNEPLISLYFQL